MRRTTVIAVLILIGACTGEVEGGPDTGTPPPPRDSGGRVDTGTPPRDTGMPPIDTGVPPVDSGMTGMDSGMTGMDSGMTGMDSGMTGMDSGMVGMDSGMVGCSLPTIPTLDTENVAGTATFSRPVHVTQAPGSTDTLWVVEQGTGTSNTETALIRLVRGGAILPTPFLSISVDRSGNERGLLGLAFHPNYAANGRFFVYYTPPGGTRRNVVAEYGRSAGDPDVANGTEVRRLVDFTDPQGNHNGGMLAFGPDGFLYAGTGDGGGSCDNHGAVGNGQNLMSLMGKILRLDVDNTGGAFAAAGNPFSGAAGLEQIWAYGLRNPWRFSFDRTTGDLWIGDVGQNRVEEVDFQPASSTGGENYGWRFYEASGLSSLPPSNCNSTGAGGITHTPPITEIPQSTGACSITGGYVYRGSAISSLSGIYLFGDFCRNTITAVRNCGAMGIDTAGIPSLSRGGGLSSFGQDNAGELYVVYLGSGQVRRIIQP